MEFQAPIVQPKMQFYAYFVAFSYLYVLFHLNACDLL